MTGFDRKKHIYSSPDFEEIIKDTIRFFNGTPAHAVPTPERFHGTGVYAIYSISKNGIYKNFHQINRTSFDLPIYVGKAVPKGGGNRELRLKERSKVTSCTTESESMVVQSSLEADSMSMTFAVDS